MARFKAARSAATSPPATSQAPPHPTVTGWKETNSFDLVEMLEGNQKFQQQRSNLGAELEGPPGVMFIGCSDNRLSSDAIFQTRPGSTVSHTNLANQFPQKDFSSSTAVDFAVNNLHVQHIVVVGHYGCKGVHTAMSSQALDSVTRRWLQPVTDLFSRSKRSEIKKLRYFLGMFDEVGAAKAKDDAFRALVEENVKATVQNIQNESVLSAAYRSGAQNSQIQVFVHGLVVLESGEVKNLGISVGPPGQPIQELPLDVIPPQEHHNSFGKYKPKARKREPTPTINDISAVRRNINTQCDILFLKYKPLKNKKSSRAIDLFDIDGLGQSFAMLHHLSEKAKGKQKAVEPQPPDESSSDRQQPLDQARDLVIRFTEGIPDLTVLVSHQDAVRDVKKKIRDERPKLSDRRLRLIHSGRLLTEGTLLYSWLASLEERQKRAVQDESVAGNQPSNTPPGITWLHCSVGPKLAPGETEEGRLQIAQLQPARGFDRLSSIGFSEADIANFRRQFHSQSTSNYLDLEFETEEEYDEHARALEEQWIDSMDNVGTASLSQSSPSHSAVLQGILLGFFFPLIPFFFMRKPKPAVFWDNVHEYEPPTNVIFSRRMQMGLVVGFLINILFGVWRVLLDSS